VPEGERRQVGPEVGHFWANFSLSRLYSHRNAWANLHRLGQPNTSLAQAHIVPPVLSSESGGKNFAGDFEYTGAPHRPRARSHCRFALPRTRFITDLLRESVPLFLKRQCDRILPPAEGRDGHLIHDKIGIRTWAESKRL
jgi:hypothetical protein